jgi:hypothetical protein
MSGVPAASPNGDFQLDAPAATFRLLVVEDD